MARWKYSSIDLAHSYFPCATNHQSCWFHWLITAPIRPLFFYPHCHHLISGQHPLILWYHAGLISSSLAVLHYILNLTGKVIALRQSYHKPLLKHSVAWGCPQHEALVPNRAHRAVLSLLQLTFQNLISPQLFFFFFSNAKLKTQLNGFESFKVFFHSWRDSFCYLESHYFLWPG